jgi:multimeric flavodoxin WrbA
MPSVVAFNGSPRKDSNTGLLIAEVLEVLEAEGIRTEMVQIGDTGLHGCRACEACRKLKNNTCSITDDPMNGWIAKVVAAQGLLLGSPTYFADVTSEMKAFIDRLGYVAGANGGFLWRKVGAAVMAVRRAGSVHAFDTMNHLFTISGMVVVGGTYWNMGIGRNYGEVLQDAEGLRNMRAIGENMAWALKRLHGQGDA